MILSPTLPTLAVTAVEGNEQEWQRYVRGNPAASLYHRLEARELIEATFSHRCRYLMARDSDGVRGVLPLVEMRSRLFGHFLASVPFFDYGGLLADDPAAANQLAGAAVRLAEEVGAGHIELRQSMAADIPWQCQTHKVALAIQVSGNPEDHWSALSSRLRGKIRKARNSGARFEIAGPEKLGDFYRVFSRNMRDLGTPVYPRALFENAMKIFSGSAHLFLVYSGREPVAGALGLQSGDNIDLPWICSHYGFSSMYANEFLYWSVLEWTCRAGLRTLDLGRSTRDSGPHRFKSQWKPREKVQHWYCWTAPGQPPPQLSPESRKFRLAVRCWRKLPVPIAGIAGPRIAKYIP